MDKSDKLRKFLFCARKKETFRVTLQKNLLLATEAINNYTELKINEFIANAIETHSGIYLYDRISSSNTLNPKVEITCPIHGDFSLLRKSHLNGIGCPKCEEEGISVVDILTPEQVYGDIEVNKQQLEHIRVNLVNFLLGRDILTLQSIIGSSNTEHDYTKNPTINSIGLMQKCPTHGLYSLIGEYGNDQYHCIKCVEESMSGIPETPEVSGTNKVKPARMLYLVQTLSDPDIYKIGVTVNIKRRLKELHNVKLICGNTISNATKYESILHKKYRGQNCYYEKEYGRGYTEYFRFNKDQVSEIVEYIESLTN